MDVGLLQYISTQLKQGIPPEEITQMLLSRGWPLEAIDAGFKYISSHPNQIENHLQVFSGTLRSPMELARDTLIFLKNRFIPIIIINSLPSLFLIIVIIFFSLYVSYLSGTTESLHRTVKVMNMETTVTLSEIPFGILIPILAFLSIFIFGLTQSALYALIAKKDRSFSITDSFHLGVKKLVPLLWTMILFCMVVFTGFTIFFIPGLICLVWFTVTPYIVMTENIHGFSALMKSKEYIRGKWFAVFWRLIAIVLFVSFGSLITGLALNTITTHAPQTPAISILNSIVLFLYSLVTWPFTMIYISFMYDDLRVGRESFEFRPSRKSWIIFLIIAAISILSLVGTIFGIFTAYHAIYDQKSDMTRIHDTENIRYALDKYYAEKHHFPSNLNELIPEYIKSYPQDPESHQPYEYKQENQGQQYEVCAQYKTKFFKKDPCLKVIKPLIPTPSPTPLPPDVNRISQLTTLQNALAQSKADTQTFPDSLNQLEGTYLFTLPTDPITHLPYQYTKQADGRDYQLCATFDIISENDNHTICFSTQKTTVVILRGIR